jgi:hypothetical protein
VIAWLRARQPASLVALMLVAVVLLIAALATDDNRRCPRVSDEYLLNSTVLYAGRPTVCDLPPAERAEYERVYGRERAS